MDSWVCVFVKTCITLPYAQRNLAGQAHTCMHILYTEAKVRRTLLQPLYSQKGVNAH